MGVDQKRPLVGFAFVAVLCAVLMTVSVGRGWSDVFQPGKPIAAAAPGGRVDHAPARTPQPGASEEAAEISIPVELSAQPLGVAVGSPAVRTSSGADSSTAGPPTTLTTTPRADRKVARQVERADRKAVGQAGKAERKAARQADKAERKAARAAEKVARKAAKAAEEAARRG